ncbi:hypothetical protein [Bosea sp. Tri-54]|uniref:hypothetical protein n=1 Tax=Bosea sp. Tri-54 TaxID=1867716 RepID=UPI00100EE082|nr:hypothetical protein [Bosea sp. Tri-54]
MYISLATAEEALVTIVRIVSGRDEVIQTAIEALSAPVYLTDVEGVVTHFNKACINFAGRRPVPGRDRWCVTWKLYTTDGEFLPHASCPMALAIKRQQPIRGLSAIAERPDGTRVRFTPFPTPIFNCGALAGAVNMMIDTTDLRQVEALREQARRCRRLANEEPGTADILRAMADDYDAKAIELEQAKRH